MLTEKCKKLLGKHSINLGLKDMTSRALRARETAGTKPQHVSQQSSSCYADAVSPAFVGRPGLFCHRSGRN